MHDESYPVGVEYRDTGRGREQRPDPWLHGRCRDPYNAEGCAELWIGLVAGGDQIVIDVAALIDRPERQQQQQQSDEVAGGIGREADRAQHPKGEVLLEYTA